MEVKFANKKVDRVYVKEIFGFSTAVWYIVIGAGQTDLAGPANGNTKVYRGGGWSSDAAGGRIARCKSQSIGSRLRKGVYDG